MQKCMQWPGGGPFNLAPGQITDDSEMAMCSLWAIVESKDELDAPNVLAKRYGDWYRSHPFDIGITTRKALHN